LPGSLIEAAELVEKILVEAIITMSPEIASAVDVHCAAAIYVNRVSRYELLPRVKTDVSVLT